LSFCKIISTFGVKTMFMFQKSHTVFTSFLEALKVKHTSNFSNGYFNEHPHKYNLFGISKMLSDYGIENAGIDVNQSLPK